MKKKTINKLFFTGCINLNMTFVLLIIGFFGGKLHAQVEFTPISSALGGAGVANLDAVEGAFLNPSVLPHHRDFSVGFVSGQGSIYKGLDENFWSLMITDGTTVVPGAFAYVEAKRTGLSVGEVKEKFYTFSLGSFVYYKTTIGLSLNRKESQISANGKYIENSYSLGGMFAPTSNLALGLVATNLANPSSEVPVELRLIPTLAVGIYYIAQDRFHFRADVGRRLRENPDKENFLKVGIESRPVDHLGFRLGFQWENATDRTLLTTGIGFLGPKLSAEYSFQNEIQKEGGPRHMFDIRMPF